MKNFIKYFGILALAGVYSCEPEFENPIDEPGAYTSGEADFSNYVAIGNSLTAGYSDGALYMTGQINSYPNILANQFAKVAPGEQFIQPLVVDNTGGLLAGGQQIQPNRLVLSVIDGDTLPKVYTGMEPKTDIVNVLSGPFNNLGVPGAKSFHLLAEGYGNPEGLITEPPTANPYFARFATSPNTTIIADALVQEPTFFSLWIGNNDVLSFATSGGAGVDQTRVNLDPTTYGPNDITAPQVFASVYSQLVNALVAAGAEGVLINIPNVTNVPFFTTVPVKAIPLDKQTAAMLNAQFKAYNEQILPGLVQAQILTMEEMQQRQINFSAGQNFVTLVDEGLTDISQTIQQPPFNLDPQTAGLLAQLRQATPSDLIPLTSSGVLGTTVGEAPRMIRGVSVPLGDENVLTTAEQELITAATTAYNQVIANIAQANELALVDSAELLKKLDTEGIAYDAGTLTSDFVTGGAFSLDGIHLTPRGYALVANKVIEEVNATYNATVPKVNIGAYGTVKPSNDVID